MYTTAASSCEQESGEVVRDFARRLRMQADVVEAVRERLRAAEQIHWESPAGRNFRSYLVDRAAGLMTTAALLREAAVSMDAYGVALQVSRPMSGPRI